MRKMAAIDIGSNAIRLAIGEFDLKNNLTIKQKIRIPLRLGKESFRDGLFSEFTIQSASKTFVGIRKIMDHERIDDYLAVATSAYRDARNSDVLAAEVKKSSEIDITCISGPKEASMILEAISTKVDMSDGHYLLVDVGGGSLELSSIRFGNLIASKSFDLGTVRVLEKLKIEDRVDQDIRDLFPDRKKMIFEFLEKNIAAGSSVKIIGTGGNFRRILKLKKKLSESAKQRDYLVVDDIEKLYSKLKSVPYLKRMKKFNLKPDRADVILPALEIIQMVMATINVERILAPDIGLIHAIMFELCGGNINELKEESWSS